MTIRLTMAQALVRYLAAQRTEMRRPAACRCSRGVWAIFGHGNVAGLGEALYGASRRAADLPRAQRAGDGAWPRSPTPRRSRRRRMMACTTSIGPGATNMVTAAAVAHVNRLPVLLLPGDVFASRRPDPVLQQVEDFGDGTVSANDCFRPVSRYFDRITRPEQILTALPRAHGGADRSGRVRPGDAGAVPGRAGRGVRLSRAASSPSALWHVRAARGRTTASWPRPRRCCAGAKKPLIIAGGGVHYSRGDRGARRASPSAHGIPVAETQAGKSALPHDHPLQHRRDRRHRHVAPRTRLAARGRRRCSRSARGCRTSPPAPGRCSRTRRARLIGLNVQPFDADKHHALPLVGDARVGLEELTRRSAAGARRDAWTRRAPHARRRAWRRAAAAVTAPTNAELPSDAQVIGAVQRALRAATRSWSAPPAACRASCTSCGRRGSAGAYHLRIRLFLHGLRDRRRARRQAGQPDREVIVMVGDGTYLMLNSEIATSVMLG